MNKLIYFLLIIPATSLFAKDFPNLDADPSEVVKFVWQKNTTKEHTDFLVTLLDYPESKNALFERSTNRGFPIHERAMFALASKFKNGNFPKVYIGVKGVSMVNRVKDGLN